MRTPQVYAALLVAVAGIAVAAVALGAWWARPTAPSRPNVVLLVLDTVRDDHLSCYGYQRPTTPVVDALAGQGVLFEDCVAPAPWTIPTHGSLFTGLYATSHGAHAEHLALSPLNVTLAEVLRDAGYETGGFSANIYLSPTLGFDQGFATYDVHLMDQPGRGKPVRDAREMNDVVLPWLEEQAHADGPFFLFVNYMDAHSPCVPPASYDTLYGTPTAPERERRIDLYDGAITYLDHEVGRVLDKIAELDLLDDTLVIVTADHGEFLGEHGVWGHGKRLYGEVLKVPLVMRYPRGLPQGQRVSGLVQLTDVMPTILALAGVDPPAAVQGRNLLPLIQGAEDPAAYTVAFAEVFRKESQEQHLIPALDRRLKSLRVDDWKYIWSSTGDEELYNLDADPGESRNLASAEPARTASMRERLDRWVGSLIRMVQWEESPGVDRAQ